MKSSLASRLATRYAALLGVTLIVVIVAMSLALVLELSTFTGDIVFAKHEEARQLTEQYRMEGQSLEQAAPAIVNAIGGVGLRIAVYNSKGAFLGGDKNLRPRILDRMVQDKHVPAPFTYARLGEPIEFVRPPGSPPPGVPHNTVFSGRPEPFSLTVVDGGFVAFEPSGPLL